MSPFDENYDEEQLALLLSSTGHHVARQASCPAIAGILSSGSISQAGGPYESS